MTTATFTLRRSLLAMALAVAYPLHGYAAPSAGVAQFIAGDVNVRRADGKTNALAKGNDLESGQSIVTGATGRAQVKFSDGGLISLQPNTEFRIANYTDNAANPKEERFVVDLLRGSMRAITGLIGKRNRENYKVTTNTATIGIRGSGFNVGYNPDGSVSVTTELDAIEVCNGGGCVGLTAGESVIVFNSTQAPVRTNVRAALPTPGPSRDPIVISDNVNGEGKAQIIAGITQTGEGITQTGEGGLPNANDGTYTNLTALTHYHTAPASSNPAGSFIPPGISSSTVISGGNPTEFQASSSVFQPVISSTSGYFGSIANGDYIGWGNWTTATKNGATNLAELHYIVGQATPTLPNSSIPATYSLVGGSVTSYTGTPGTVYNTSQLTINFGSTSSWMNVNIMTSLGNVADSYLSFSGSTFSSGSADIKGVLTGPNANHAGMIYSSSAGGFSGTAVFQAP